jgi:hypothetical protein
MRSDVGRFFEGRLLDTIKLLQVIYDIGCGAGFDVDCWIEGKEMVFGRAGVGQGRGFLRVIVLETSAILLFPRGHKLFDPAKRGKGPRNSQTRVHVRDPADIDLYVRRLIDEAYATDEF